MGRAEFAHHPALPRCYAAGIRLALEVEILGISCGFLVHSPGSSRFTFSRDEARENGFTGERRGDAFNRSIAKKSAASPQNVQITTRMCDSYQARGRRKLWQSKKTRKTMKPKSKG